MKKVNKAKNVICVAITAILGLFAIVYGKSLDSVYIQAVGSVVLYLAMVTMCFRCALASLFMLCLGIFVLSVDVQLLEFSRILIFCLIFVFINNENTKRSIFMSALALWLIFLSAHLLPIAVVNEFIVGLSPIPTTSTLELMFAELFFLSIFGLLPSSRIFKEEAAPLSLAKLFTHLVSIPLSGVALLMFYLGNHPEVPLAELPTFSTSLLLVLAVASLMIKFVVKVANEEFQNMISHFEIFATPDSSFLTYSKKAPLPLVEYRKLSKILRTRAKSISKSRRELKQANLQYGTLQRESSEKNILNENLELIIHNLELMCLSINKDGYITFANEKFSDFAEIEFDTKGVFHYQQLSNKLDPVLINLKYALEWSLDNFDKLNIGSECPFQLVNREGNRLRVFFKSYQPVDDSLNDNEPLMIAYITEKEKVAMTEIREEGLSL